MLTKYTATRVFGSHCSNSCHDDVIKYTHFYRYWPFVGGINRSPVDSSHRGQLCRDLMFSLICAWKNVWNNRDAGDLRRHYCSNSCDYDNYLSAIGTYYCIYYSQIIPSDSCNVTNSLYRGQLRRYVLFSLICAWTNGWKNDRDAGDLRRHRAHYCSNSWDYDNYSSATGAYYCLYCSQIIPYDSCSLTCWSTSYFFMRL